MASLVSPNELFQAAKDVLLAGEDPATHDDWTAVFHYFAAHIIPEAQMPALKILNMLYNEHLTEAELQAISNYEIALRK